MNRRDLLALSAAALATPAAAAPADPIARMIVVNALGGLNDPNLEEPKRAAVTPRILRDAHASGMTAVNCTIGYVAGPQEPFQQSVADVGQYDALIRAHPKDPPRSSPPPTSPAPRPSGRSASSTGSRTRP